MHDVWVRGAVLGSRSWPGGAGCATEARHQHHHDWVRQIRRCDLEPARAGRRYSRLYVCVADVDAHFRYAQSAGAEITSPPEETDFGSRDYHVRDLEGHPWTFGTYLPDVAAG